MYLLNFFNRCWLLYILIGFVLFRAIDQRVIHYQFLDSYRPVVNQLSQCVLESCGDHVLKEGVLYYSHFTKVLPELMEGHNALGYCLYNLQDFRRSIKSFDEAVRLNPKNPGLYFNQTMALLQLGDYVKALDSLKKGISIFSPDTFFYTHMVIPFKKQLPPDIANQPASQLSFAADQYKKLLALTEQITRTTEPLTKKKLIENLHQKIKAYGLYYYMPLYHMNINGQPTDFF